MDIKEIATNAINTFLKVFFCSIVAVSVHLRFNGVTAMDMNNIFALTAMSALVAFLTELIFYSKKALSKMGLLIRHLLHLLAMIVSIMPVAFYMRWASWDEPIRVIIVVCLILGVWGMVTALEFYQTKKSTSQLEKKLKERTSKI